MTPALCFQDPPIVDFHSKSSKAPMVSHFFMGIGFCFVRRSCKALEGMPNPIAPPDLMARIAMTLPSKSRVGLPLLPGSIGMATCTIGLPSPSSSSRIAATTPRLTLWLYPRGLPKEKIACPGSILFESPSSRVGKFFASILTKARSRSRSTAKMLWGRKVLPLAKRMAKSRCSPMT